ncbi:TolC family protein [Castellaniella defragrans]|uniref:Protease secretion system outer membrane protein n=2 Tax=Castellaniella defragrans TaxID=75697 RepID=A0A7W9TNQ3_CASDE|nr:TolC family protein [Castellaniella defragrans]MBB6084090.1 protease secretion system outer membrane protein [Castellaniella defragrans]
MAGWGWIRLGRGAGALALSASLAACAGPGAWLEGTWLGGGKGGGAPSSEPTPAAPAPAAGPRTGATLADALDRMDAARARGLTLAQAWPLALARDPTYQAALSARLGFDTFRAQGLALLLPQVQAGYSRSRINGLRRQPWLFGRTIESVLEYDSTSAYVQLQQPLLDAGRYASYRWAHARADQGDADWAAARSDLAQRLSKAWFQLLAARSTVALREGLADSLEAQAAGQQALYTHSEGSIIDAQQIQARLASARADVISARADLDVAQRALQAIIGVTDRPPASPFAWDQASAEASDRVPGQTSDRTPAEAPDQAAAELTAFAPPPLEPARLVDWLDLARAHNTQIDADQAKVRVAEADVWRAASRHAPTLNLVAAWSNADSENLSTLSQRTNTYVLGLQLNVPIFSGGYDSALHAQTRDQARQAAHTLDATVESTLVEVTRQYSNVTGGEERIRALESAVRSGRASLAATRKVYQHGHGSILDMLRKQDNLFQTRAQLIQAQLDYLQARIALEVAAGRDLAEVFERITGVFPQ